ncbi:MAG TPA: YncE family protein, partial [Bacteroidia bacterium]|nr:YncE family protein [Bacteroidia bacterium]
MKNCAFFSFVACFLFLPLFTRAQTAAGNTAVMLPNGWRLSPVGKSLPLGDLPLNIAVSPDRKMLAVTNNGVGSQTVQLIDAVSHIQLDAVTVGKSWLGLAFSDDSKNLYVSGGNDNFILRFDIKNKRLLAKDT